MIRAEKHEELSKFVKVTARILSVPFFQTRCTSVYHMLYRLKST